MQQIARLTFGQEVSFIGSPAAIGLSLLIGVGLGMATSFAEKFLLFRIEQPDYQFGLYFLCAFAAGMILFFSCYWHSVAFVAYCVSHLTNCATWVYPSDRPILISPLILEIFFTLFWVVGGIFVALVIKSTVEIMRKKLSKTV